MPRGIAVSALPHQETALVEAEIALWEEAVAEVEKEKDPSFPSGDEVLPGMRAVLKSCRKTLIELQEQLDRGVTH
jgi:hypothetical protein